MVARLFPRRSALTLVELLLTLAVLGILAAVLIPQLTSDLPDRLGAAAQVVSVDLEYARGLAVSNNSKYTVTFNVAQNRYYVRHTGDNALLNVLPPSPFRQTDDPPDRQSTELADLPLPEPGVRLAGVVRMKGQGVAVTDVVFYPDGDTTEYPDTPDETIVWLVCGQGTQARYISVHVNGSTGLVEIGPLRAAPPSTLAAAAEPVTP